jgi:hypothetical protein
VSSGSRLIWGPHPSSRHEHGESTSSAAEAAPARALPRARVVPPSGFLSLSAGCSSPRPAALFHAAATCRVRPFRGFPFRTGTPARHPRRPSCRYTYGPGRTIETTLPFPKATGFRALLRPKVRLLCSDVTPHRGPIPSWDFWPLPGSQSLCRARARRLPLRSCPWPEARSDADHDPKARAGAFAVPLAGLQRIAGQGARLASFESCRPA